MATIKIISPTDQPTGKNRLLKELDTNLQDNRFNEFMFIVAFAKVSPLLKLNDKIIEWKKSKTIDAIFGVDQKGTSIEVLQFAIDNFRSTYVLHVLGKYRPTFHPKIYLFKRANDAIAYVGSNNLTVGGTETNFESYVRIKMGLPKDQAILDEIEESWNNCKDSSIKLDNEYLEKLISNDLIIAESAMKKQNRKSKASQIDDETGNENIIEFPFISIQPPMPIPKNILVSGLSKKVKKSDKTDDEALDIVREDVPVSTLLMQYHPTPQW